MTEPVRERVMTNLLARLQGINSAGGYLTDPKPATRKMRPLANISAAQTPLVMLTEGINENIKPEFVGPTIKKSGNQFGIMVRGVFADPTGSGTLGNRLVQDVMRCILADITFGSLCDGLTPGTTFKVTRDLGDFLPMGVFNIEWSVQFREDLT